MSPLKILIRRKKFWANLTFAYVSRYKVRLILALTLIAVSIFSAYRISTTFLESNILSIGYVGVYSLDILPLEVLSLATQPLIAIDQAGRPVASLASHWTSSEDGKTYQIFLKDNLKWHDSTDVNARDVSIAISGVRVTALNNKVIEFKLPNPIVSFPLALNKPVFKSRSFYGIGDYRIVNIKEVGMVVKQIDLVSKNKNLPRVTIKFYQNEAQALNALKIGEIKYVKVTSANELQEWPNQRVTKQVDNWEIITIFYNTEDPLLSSKEMRQALSYAINKDNFDGIAAQGPISPNSWAFAQNTKRYDYNQGKAKELLAKAQVEKPNIKLSFSQGLEATAKKIQNDWEAIGIKTSISSEKSNPASFQAYLAINQLMPDPDQYSLWHSTQTSTNITQLKDVKVDKILEDARSEKDEAKRKELYSEFQKSLTENLPAAFLYHPYKYQIAYKNAQGLLAKLPK